MDGRPWPAESWTAHANEIMAEAPDLTYFEFLTVLALLLFREEKVDVAVLEAGLGGRHDATTAVPAGLLCYAPIALDHRDVLGPTLTAIATDKAAAVRGPAPVCTARNFRRRRVALKKPHAPTRPCCSRPHPWCCWPHPSIFTLYPLFQRLHRPEPTLLGRAGL